MPSPPLLAALFESPATWQLAASGQVAGHAAAAAVAAGGAGWRAAAHDPHPWWRVDFGRRLRFGGVVIAWPDGLTPRANVMEVSAGGAPMPGVTWQLPGLRLAPPQPLGPPPHCRHSCQRRSSRTQCHRQSSFTTNHTPPWGAPASCRLCLASCQTLLRASAQCGLRSPHWVWQVPSKPYWASRRETWEWHQGS